MGQGSSRPQRGPQRSSPQQLSRDTAEADGGHWRSVGDLVRDTEERRQLFPRTEEAGTLMGGQPRRRPHTRSNSTANRLSRLLHSSSDAPLPSDADSSSRPSALQRSRTTLSNMFRREDGGEFHSRPSRRRVLLQRSSHARASAAGSDEGDYYPPRLPSIEQTSTFDHDLFAPSEHEAPPRSSGSQRLQNIRFNALRPDRPFRNLTSSFRRRRSPPPSSSSLRRPDRPEDQAAMLSRLLSIAAAATAASLMGDDQNALREARSLTGGTGFGDMNEGEEDGSFDGFLRALQNGRIASALRQDQNGPEGGENGQDEPLNFFRMFRFGAHGQNQNPGEQERPEHQSQEGNDAGYSGDARMVPIIIVGIRSISPNSNSSSNSVDELPPFMDALGANFSQPHTTYDHESIDSILRPPQNGTSFRHRRRASMGGLGMGRSRMDDRYDAQRDHRSPDRRRERPWSMASSGSNYEPRPPPATPASPSPELSRISSRNTTPSHSRPTSMIANSIRDFAPDSRRNSVLHRSAASPLSSHTEETVSLHSSRSSDNLLSHHQRERDSFRGHRRSETAPNVHYPRFASGHPRRNGVVEPDNLPSLSRSSTSNATETTAGDNAGSGARDDGRRSTDSRSWIIYVLGGSYPENHPILSTPSLFTENPTYEDMMLLSTLLGPGKPPVATEEDVQSSGGVYDIVVVKQPEPTQQALAKNPRLAAIATADTDKTINPERVALEVDHSCLVCLCDFEAEDVARRLAKCGHLFHKECIDQWLTTGRNSCPLCRGQGVNETEKAAAEGESAQESAPAEVPAT